VFRDVGLFMNLMGHVRQGASDITLRFAVEKLHSTHRIIKKYNQCVRLARYASNSRYRWVLPDALLRIVEGVGFFIVTLKTEGQAETAQRYRASTLQICRLAVWIAEQNQDDAVLSHGMATVMLLTGKEDGDTEHGEVVKLAREILAKIKDQQQRQVSEQLLDRAIRRTSGEKVEGDPESDLLRQVVENRASSLGVDMNNPEDLTAKLVRLGIKDANPERVLKHCEHAFVSITGKVAGWENMIAASVQLPSIRAKILHCDLFDYAAEGRTLDAAFEHFKTEYCDKCKDISPRASDWKYSDEWQQAENERHREFMTKFHRKS
jgi:hypothetical protein